MNLDIYEDDFDIRLDDENDDKISYLPDEEINEPEPVPEKPAQKPEPQTDGTNPGTRIIFQAPERSSKKREFTGFVDEKPAEETVTEEEEEIVAAPTRTGGHDFEAQMRRHNTTPERKRPEPSARPSDEEMRRRFEEEKRRRYQASLEKAAREKAERERRKKEQLFLESDMEDIDMGKAPRSTADKLRIAVMVVAVIAMIAGLSVLAKQLIQQRQGAGWEEEVTGLLIDVPGDEETTKKPSKKPDKKDEKETESTTERVLTIEEQWAELYKNYPNVTFPDGLSLKYAKLYAVNQDFVGYISIDALGVGLPVVQSEKDTKKENYYLRKNFYKQYSVYGCPFVPKDNDMQNLDRNTIIFGHNNNSNIAFAPINKYKTIEGYRSAPVIQFDTIYASHKWKIVAAFIINTVNDDDNGYIFNYTFTKMQSDEEFMTYIRFVKERSLYDTGIDILPSDKILTLSTCTHDFDNARFVVIARLVRPGETEDVNTAVATVNERPRYPQAYYDKKKKKNPYKGAENWFYSGS